MFDIGWSEFALIAVVALIVIGPKDLPKVLKTIGIWVRKARMLTRDFQNSVDEMIREADLEDVRRQANELRTMNLAKEVERTIDPSGSLRDAFDPNITARPRAEGDGTDDEAAADHAAHDAERTVAARLPAPVAEPGLPAAPIDLKTPEPAALPTEPANSSANSHDKRA